MGNKTKVDKQWVIDQFRAGMTEGEITDLINKDRHKISRQRINQIKNRAIKEGKLSKTKQTVKPIAELALDQVTEAIITAFEKAQRYDILVAERDKYKRGYENAMAELAQRDKEKKVKERQTQRWRLAQQKPNLAEV